MKMWKKTTFVLAGVLAAVLIASGVFFGVYANGVKQPSSPSPGQVQAHRQWGRNGNMHQGSMPWRGNRHCRPPANFHTKRHTRTNPRNFGGSWGNQTQPGVPRTYPGGRMPSAPFGSQQMPQK